MAIWSFDSMRPLLDKHVTLFHKIYLQKLRRGQYKFIENLTKLLKHRFLKDTEIFPSRLNINMAAKKRLHQRRIKYSPAFVHVSINHLSLISDVPKHVFRTVYVRIFYDIPFIN